MKIFITGIESFIGKELIRHCEMQGIEYVGVDVINSGDQNCYFADIRSKNIVDLIPRGIDAIVHLAALSRDSDCKDKAYECFDINVMGTANLIEAAHAKKVKQFIFASSEWVYDSFNEGEAKDEESSIDITKHTSEYALSKIVCETILRLKYHHGFCPVTILRFGIVYGPRKTNWSAVESIFNAIKNKDEITVGSLKTARRFIHVSDISSGIIKSLGIEGFNIINLQGDKIVSLGDIIDAGSKILNKTPKVSEINPANANIRDISNKKSKELLNWKPTISLEEGLLSLLNEG